MSAHRTPEETRKGLTHPVIDGDGHCYTLRTR